MHCGAFPQKRGHMSKVKQYYILQWQNKYSGETGFVGHIREKYFENTYNVDEARKFANVGSALLAINKLSLIGECDNNDFSVVPL